MHLNAQERRILANTGQRSCPLSVRPFHPGEAPLGEPPREARIVTQTELHLMRSVENEE